MKREARYGLPFSFVTGEFCCSPQGELVARRSLPVVT